MFIIIIFILFYFDSSYHPKLTGGPKVVAHTARVVSYSANSRLPDYLYFLNNVGPCQPISLSNITWPCKGCARLWVIFYCFRVNSKVRRRDFVQFCKAYYASRGFHNS